MVYRRNQEYFLAATELLRQNLQQAGARLSHEDNADENGDENPDDNDGEDLSGENADVDADDDVQDGD